MSDFYWISRSNGGFWLPAILHAAVAFRALAIQNFSVVR
jgi:hypothetical protein